MTSAGAREARLRSSIRCWGLVLAGGRGRRMGGASKGLLEVGGARMVDRVAHALRESADALALASNADGAAEWLSVERVIPDRIAGAGPLAGLHAALETLDAPVLAVAWDMPFASAALLRELRRIGEADARLSAAVPESAPGALEPLCAWYAPSCTPHLARALHAGQRRVRDVVATLPGLYRVSASQVARHGDPALLLSSVNTPEELERARSEAVAR